MSQSVIRLAKAAKRLDKPRPLKLAQQNRPSPVDGHARLNTVEEIMALVEHVSAVLKEGNWDSTLLCNIILLCNNLKTYGQHLESIYKDQLDRAFINFRNGSRDDHLDNLSRVFLLEIIELRATNWQGGDDLLTYYKSKTNVEIVPPPPDTPTLTQPLLVQAPSPTAPQPPMLSPGEVIKNSGKFAKPTKIPGKNYCKDEVVIRNSDSGKGVMFEVYRLLAHSSLVYCIMLAVLYIYLQSGHGSEVFSDHNNFDSSLYTYYSFILGIPVFVTPVFFWSQAPGIADLFARWNKFLETYRRLTAGKTVHIDLYRRCVLLVIMIPITVLAVELFYGVMGIGSWTEFTVVLVYFTYVNSVRGVLVVLWYLECAAICRASTQLLAMFNAGAISYPSCRAIWLELSRLAVRTGIATGYTFVFYMVYLFMKLTVTIYELLNRSVGDLHLEWGNLWIITESVVICFVLYVICESADNVTFHVMTVFKIKLVHLKTISTRNSKEDKQIVSLLVTDLVVLLQLKMSSTTH